MNHASIIDGIRLCRARRERYAHGDMADLERCLQEAKAKGARFTMVFTDGVFSMDGTIAQLDAMRGVFSVLGVSEVGGAVRIGLAHYTTAAEVDLLADALADLRT